VLREALERRSPVADPALRPAVELRGGGAPVLGKRRGVEGRDRAEPAGSVGEEVAPEGAGVAERPVEVDRDSSHRPRRASAPLRARSTTPAATPKASISQSIGEACRPPTKA